MEEKDSKGKFPDSLIPVIIATSIIILFIVGFIFDIMTESKQEILTNIVLDIIGWPIIIYLWDRI